MRYRWELQRGFTIVELLIVIVVIGILATVTIVSYVGVQDRAKDASMRVAANEVEDALQQWGLDRGDSIKGGWGSTTAAGASGCSDGLNGFFDSGAYTCTVEDALVSARLLPLGFSSKLPDNPVASSGGWTMMIYYCPNYEVGSYALYWNLRQPNTQDSDSIDDTLAACGHSAGLRDNYGMRAAKIIEL